MKNKIYNELNRDPLVWGLHFPTLMTLVSFLVISTTICINTMAVWGGLLLSFSLSFILYLVLMKYTTMDKVELYARFQRAVSRHIDSMNTSSQLLLIR